MALIGTGSQAEFQALAFRGVLGIRKLRIWDTDPLAMDKFVRNTEPLGFDIVIAKDASDAACGADIITTCTADKAQAKVLTVDQVPIGVHINAIGGDCPGKTELDPRILLRADVFVEYPPQARIEGEIQQMNADFEVTEIWRVLDGQVQGRISPEQITIFDSVGFAIEDFSALRYLRDTVEDTPYYEELDMIANPVDPKDLYALVAAPVSAEVL
jgi:ornithine cyclodeaminase